MQPGIPAAFALLMVMSSVACSGSVGGDSDAGMDGQTQDANGGDLPADLDTSDGDAGGPGDEQQPAFEFPAAFLSQDVAWWACDLFDGTGDGRAECTDVAVPLYWDHPDLDHEAIGIRAKRLLAPGAAARQLWLLQGGPGGSGTYDFPGLMQIFQQHDPALDVYVLDHRGVGHSSYMGCPDQEDPASAGGATVTEAELPACIDYLQNDWLGVEGFSTTNAAIDLAGLIELTREPGKSIFVLGVSYGTYWGHRYAQIFPEQANGIILDSIAPSDFRFELYDVHANQALGDYLDLCAAAPPCSSRLGADPWSSCQQALQEFKQGHCNGLRQFGIDPLTLQMAAFLHGCGWHQRVLVPAMFYRLARCNRYDVRALRQAVAVAFASYSHPGFSRALGNTVIESEMLGPDVPSPQEVMEQYESMLIWGSASYRVATLHGVWPSYPPDVWMDEWASREAPLLMLNGTLDLQTPIQVAQRIRDHLDGAHQYFVEVPGANHGVILESPVETQGEPDCGMQLVLDYLQDPRSAPDTACLADLLPIEFAGSPELARSAMLAGDIWDNPVPALTCTLPGDTLDPLATDYVLLVYRGTITSQASMGTPGVSWSEASLGDSQLDIDGYQAYSYLHAEGQPPAVNLQTVGDLEILGSNHLRYLFLHTVLPVETIETLARQGQHRRVLTDPPPVTLEILRIEEKYTDTADYNKNCPVAVLNPDDLESFLYLCHQDNPDFTPGQPLDIAVNAILCDDPDLVGNCLCFKDYDQSISCAEFDAVETRGRTTGRDIGYPFRFVRPDMPPPLNVRARR